MMIRTTNNADRFDVVESIFDTRTGFRYNLMKRGEVAIESVVGNENNSLWYYGEEAKIFWKHLIETAESMVG